MPKYRQLHVKILDSFDFSDMPNDFTRVFWLLLIIVVDSNGRGIDNAAWLRSKMFPLRQDVEIEQIASAMDWLSERKMVTRYTVNGNGYFFIPSFKNYQSGCDKEAKSVLPEPPELLPSSSEPTPPQYNTIQYNTDTKSDSDAEPPTNFISLTPQAAVRLFSEVTGMAVLPNTSRTEDDITIILDLIRRKGRDEAKEIMARWWEWWKAGKSPKTGKPWSRTNTAWLEKAMNEDAPNGVINSPAGLNQSSNGGVYV